MIEILKALFWVIVAALFRFFGLTQKKPTRFVGSRRAGSGEEPRLPEWKKDAVRKANYIVDQVLTTDDFTQNEKNLIFTMTHVMSGLADQPGVILKCHFQFLPDQKVRIDFLAEDTLTGQPLPIRLNDIEDNEISIKGRGYLADYIKGLIHYQAEKDRVTNAMRVAAATIKGGNHDQADRPDEDENHPG